jgi:hypothetical protein
MKWKLAFFDEFHDMRSRYKEQLCGVRRRDDYVITGPEKRSQVLFKQPKKIIRLFGEEGLRFGGDLRGKSHDKGAHSGPYKAHHLVS